MLLERIETWAVHQGAVIESQTREKVVYVVVLVNILAHHSPQFHPQPIVSRGLSGISKDSVLPVVNGGSYMLQLSLFCLAVLFEDPCHTWTTPGF